MVSQVKVASRPSAEPYICLSAVHCLQVYLFERTPGGEWAQSGVSLLPLGALSEASGQTGKLSAAFMDKLALFKGHASQVSIHAASPALSH